MKYGEIIELGRHRLMCGDATRYNDIEQLLCGERVNLVLTDPPYGVDSVNERTGQLGDCGKRYAPIIGDNYTDMAEEHYKIVRTLCNHQIFWVTKLLRKI